MKNISKFVFVSVIAFCVVIMASLNVIASASEPEWSALGDGVGSAVHALAFAPNGDLYVGGWFATASGVEVNHIARWDGSNWSALGSGVAIIFDPLRPTTADVSALAFAPNGDLFAGGSFVTAGGVTANSIARWNGTSWSAVGGGVDGGVTALAIAPNGDLYVGGWFTTAGDVTANSIARWNGTSWSAVGGGVDNTVSALAFAPNGDLYVGGWFTTAGDVEVNSIARWNGTSWSAVGGGIDDGVRTLAFAPNGDLFAGGDFVTAGGVTANSIARWNGTSWSAVGGGVDYGVRTLAFAPNGDLFASGNFVTVDGVEVNHIARWNGTSWSALGEGLIGVMTESVEGAYALAFAPNGDLFAGGNFITAGGVEVNGVAMWNSSLLMPTPTPPPSQNRRNTSNSRSFSAPRVAFCNDRVPVGVPDLFQITRNGSTATLYFTPVNDNVNHYHVVYGHNAGQELYGWLSAEVTPYSNNGVQRLVIRELNPLMTYSFQVMPAYGCAVGERSNWLTANRSGNSYR